MNLFLELADYVAACMFGCILSFSFCGVENTKRNRWLAVWTIAGLLAAQGLCYAAFGLRMSIRLYPLIVHLPLVVILTVSQRRPPLWPLVSVLTAYFCCEPRIWPGLIFAQLCPDLPWLRNAAELLFTPLLLWIFLRYVAPFMGQISQVDRRKQALFGAIPVVYYGYYYLTAVYTDLLYTDPDVVNALPTLCLLTFILFSRRLSAVEKASHELEMDNRVMTQQIQQSLVELNAMRRSQEQAGEYRHDLRHHFQYILSCLETGEQERAQQYIHGLFRDIEAQRVVTYCENESANLILSAYASRCAAAEIPLKIEAALPQWLHISNQHLTVLLSNALENAVRASALLPPADRWITVQCRQKGDKLLIQVENACGTVPRFVDGLPVSDRAGHGFGTRSIRAVTELYRGLCDFSAGEGRFTLRLFL